MRYFLLSFYLFILHTSTILGQDKLQAKTTELELLKTKEKELVSEIEQLKLKQLINQMKLAGLPVSNKEVEIIEHSGLILGFDCNYKMASWAFHVLTPEVSFGTITRTNDFRVDDQASCGSAVEADYFVRQPKADGTFTYDGFGFDRGHLAPSADFRWSATALSESYYYSNMTPQRPEFNRESWAELEGLLRSIVDQEKKPFYVITGPILNENLPVIEKSVNKLKIPEYHYKIIVDLSTGTPRGMAFLMPNKKCESRMSNYVVSIDSIEKLTGLDFFPNVDEQLETTIEAKADFGAWKTQTDTKNVEPLKATELPKGYYNTEQAASKVGSTVSIVGKVVSTKYLSKSQATFLNLDQSFPNQLFTVIIWKDGRRNFSYQPEQELEGKYIVVTGKVELDKNGVPGITVTKEEQIEIWE
jgi:endonuclease G